MPVWGGIALCMIALISVADYLTGSALAFSIFYLVPISLATWFVGKRAGIIAAALCAVAWLATLVANGHAYSNTLVPIWNLIVGVGLFVCALVILSTLRDALDHERELARTDTLTGAANSRAFAERARFELKRAARYNRPFSLAYIDVDNFKVVNDRFGHGAGDELLRTVAKTLNANLRPTDTVARLGGDEFVILFVEAGYREAQAAIRRVQKSLAEIARESGWPVTFSIGMVTCEDPAESVEVLLKMADTLMYGVKRGSKNGLRHELLDKTAQVA
ncbi:MAG TPA: GGDEF domain-containing protein [Chloroflexia bacterium]|nr:GGDEF domain-containing protein [Chloroflexia bacterium]